MFKNGLLPGLSSIGKLGRLLAGWCWILPHDVIATGFPEKAYITGILQATSKGRTITRLVATGNSTGACVTFLTTLVSLWQLGDGMRLADMQNPRADMRAWQSEMQEDLGDARG